MITPAQSYQLAVFCGYKPVLVVTNGAITGLKFRNPSGEDRICTNFGTERAADKDYVRRTLESMAPEFSWNRVSALHLVDACWKRYPAGVRQMLIEQLDIQTVKVYELSNESLTMLGCMLNPGQFIERLADMVLKLLPAKETEFYVEYEGTCPIDRAS